jgi:hypothetical protein
MEGHLYILLISSRSINKHGCHRQFLFLIDRFLKKRIILFGSIQLFTEVFIQPWRIYLCLGYIFLPVSTIFLLNFWPFVQWYFLLSLYVSNHFNHCIKLFAPCGALIGNKKFLFLFYLNHTFYRHPSVKIWNDESQYIFGILHGQTWAYQIPP